MHSQIIPGERARLRNVRVVVWEFSKSWIMETNFLSQRGAPCG